jgi:hypothetical protein
MRWNKKVRFILKRLEQVQQIDQTDLEKEVCKEFNLRYGKQWINYLKDIGIIKVELYRVPYQKPRKVRLIYDGEKVAQERKKLSARFSV